MKKRESYKKHLNRGVMAVSFAVIFIVFSIMGGRIQAFADDAVATQTDAAKSNSSGPVTTGLAIDGYYGEWSQYPSADITYNSNNGYSVHKGQIAIDGDRLYVHFSMNDLYTSQMQFQFWNITVDGKQCVLNVLPVNSDGSINWSGQMYNLGEGIYRNFGVFAGYYTDIDGDVAFTVYDAAHTETGKGDEIEFSISMKKLADYLGINIDQGATITVSNPNIGAQGVTITGTPTGPWAGAAMAMALATGGDTHKMKYGHRGGNHPVKDLETGRVYISSQNHGYVVDAEGLEEKNIAHPAFVNVNDGTNEGMAYNGKNIFTVQFHPEACPGPQDSSYLFDRFMKMMGGEK